jgi:hypothetical protein
MDGVKLRVDPTILTPLDAALTTAEQYLTRSLAAGASLTPRYWTGGLDALTLQSGPGGKAVPAIWEGFGPPSSRSA